MRLSSFPSPKALLLATGLASSAALAGGVSGSEQDYATVPAAERARRDAAALNHSLAVANAQRKAALLAQTTGSNCQIAAVSETQRIPEPFNGQIKDQHPLTCLNGPAGYFVQVDFSSIMRNNCLPAVVSNAQAYQGVPQKEDQCQWGYIDHPVNPKAIFLKIFRSPITQTLTG